MRIAVLCDVDQTVYHVGDEAIATATSTALGERGFEAARISRQEKYGPSGSPIPGSIPALTFPWEEPARVAYMQEIRDVLAGDTGRLPAHDKFFAIREALAGTDALVIGGGGSLNSRYGWLLDERVATALVMQSLGKPVVLSGQSLGPALTPGDRRSLSELLQLCSLVGVRDEHSLHIARQLAPDHPALTQIRDDAVLMGPALRGSQRQHDLVSVTLAADTSPVPRAQFVSVMAQFLDAFVDRTGAHVRMIAHMADPDEGGVDEQLHADVARAMRHPAECPRLLSDKEAAAEAARSAWVITTRFHPLIFGQLGGAQVLALAPNRYGWARMDGALRNAGIENGTIPLAALWDPLSGGPSGLHHEILDVLFGEVLTTEIPGAGHGTSIIPPTHMHDEAAAWWDAVAQELREPGWAHTHRESIPTITVATQPRFPADLERRLAPFRARSTDDGGAQPQVAIVMRTKDRPELLDRAIQDVLGQSRGDWELLVVNDAGDPARVDEVITRYEREAAGRIRVLHRTESTGMESASNAGIQHTTAPLLAIHDDDDTWDPSFLHHTISHLHAHPDHDAVVVRARVITEQATPVGMTELFSHTNWEQLTGAHLLNYMRVNRHVPIAMLYRRSLHDKIGAYNEAMPVVGDYDFYLRMLLTGPVGFIDRELAHWRLRPQADGATSNSMFAQAASHREADFALADQYFRAWTAEHGIGLPMFISRTVHEQVVESEQRLREEMTLLREELAKLNESSQRQDLLRLPRRIGSGLAWRARAMRDAAARKSQRGIKDPHGDGPA